MQVQLERPAASHPRPSVSVGGFFSPEVQIAVVVHDATEAMMQPLHPVVDAQETRELSYSASFLNPPGPKLRSPDTLYTQLLTLVLSSTPSTPSMWNGRYRNPGRNNNGGTPGNGLSGFMRQIEDGEKFKSWIRGDRSRDRDHDRGSSSGRHSRRRSRSRSKSPEGTDDRLARRLLETLDKRDPKGVSASENKMNALVDALFGTGSGNGAGSSPTTTTNSNNANLFQQQ